MRNTIPILLATACSSACMPAYRTEVVAANSVSFPQPGTASLVAELSVAETSADIHTLLYAVHLPRAVELEYVVSCPGGEARGTLGETFEAYRERRLAELEEQRRQQAALIGSLVGAAVPSVRVGAQVSAPGVQGSAQAGVAPGAVAEAAVYAATPQAQLPPGDVGARTVEGSLELDGMVPGTCILTLESRVPGQDVSGVAVELALDRSVDLAAEERARIAAVRAEASRLALDVRTSVVVELGNAGATLRTTDERLQFDLDLRGSIAAGLVAAGADPGLRARLRAEAEAERLRIALAQQAELEAELALEATRRQAEEEAQRERARLAAEVRLRDEAVLRGAWLLRVDLQSHLIGLGADPLFRQRQYEEALRLRDEARAEELRLAAEARARDAESFRLGMDFRLDFAGFLVGLGADPHRRQREAELAARAVPAAFGLRDVVVRGLIALGADPTYRQRRLEEEQRLRLEQSLQWQAELRGALELRESLCVQLLALGAVERPPMPPARLEVIPPAPFAGAAWIEGGYVWRGGAWVWVAGQWSTQAAGAFQLGPLTIDLGGGTAAVGVGGGSATVELGGGTTVVAPGGPVGVEVGIGVH